MINLNTVANANHVATTTLDNKTNVATATEVNKQVNTGASAVVELQTNVADVNAEFIPIIEKGLQEYADSVEAKLREIKVDLKHENIVYVGGGASVMKKYGRTKGRNIQYVTDVKANAIGYRYLADNIG